jgi:F0F1-type ATP synthase delta subunit
MDKQLRDLAFAIIRTKKVDETLVDGLIAKLSAKDIEKFLSYLRIAQEKNTITITTVYADPSISRFFEKKYADMQISYKTDDTIGGGVIVKIADDVYDYSVRNYISTTIDRLTE